MEAPDKRIVWITNQIEHIDQAVRRRFSFSICFEELGEPERRGLWEEIIARHGIKNCFTEHQVKTLASNYKVSAAIIEKAVSQAKELGYAKNELGDAVERALRAYATLSRDGAVEGGQSKEATRDFNPDGISLDSPLQELMDKCRRVDAAMRGTNPLPNGCATMLFYGPPGTGKTALARHIAKELNRECFVRRASDLLSPYVGVAEQQIAEAFRHMEKDGSVLLIDEVDTFLYSREMAQRSWETSLVNEFLTALEECRGFCICTTNRMENLDAAAVRRFSHKVAFDYAKPQQVQVLYSELLAPLCRQKLPSSLEKELQSFSMLTPGDFRTVRSQYDSFFSEKPDIDHDALIAALRREESLKAKLQTHRIGF
jgi:AAA+ superfamily predicted ATPase